MQGSFMEWLFLKEFHQDEYNYHLNTFLSFLLLYLDVFLVDLLVTGLMILFV